MQKMQKKFNITGLCFPDQHYMADVSKKHEQTFDLIDKGKYFIINRPRQYGKTTMLHHIARTLRAQGDYAVFNCSFEGVGDAFFETEERFTKGFIRLLARQIRFENPTLSAFLHTKEAPVNSFDNLSDAITDIVIQINKKVIVLIDEVDKSSNNQLFVSFLAVLRNKYLERGDVPTFHSVILAGLHDVKSLKLKLRPDEEQKYNSPWNIAAEYKVDMNLQIAEIVPMLEEYKTDKNVAMNTHEIAEHLFYYTSGYPFLVSKLCKILDEDYKKHDIWTKNDIEIAVKQLVRENNTNFETLSKNIQNNQALYDLVYKVAIDGESIALRWANPTINFGILYGIFANNTDTLKIHNRIYSEVLVDTMSSDLEVKGYAHNNIARLYKYADGTLNMQSVMLGFQEFMKKEYNKKDRDFLEKNGRLVFLAFIKPIINGEGYDFKEVEISEEKRLDIVVTHRTKKYVIELKIWYGAEAHERGLAQLSDYLDRQKLTDGYLLIFDHSKIKKWKSEEIVFENKKIFAAWV